MTTDKRQTKKKLGMASIKRKMIVEGSVILIFWTIAAYVLIFTERRWIPSGNMEPTLHGTPNQWEADKIIVDKLKYKFYKPQRGDIVVFSPTEELKKEQYQDPFLK